MMSASNIHFEMAERDRAINYGGIGAIHLMGQRLGLAQEIDSRLQLLNFHEPKVMQAEPVSAGLVADLSVFRAGVLKVAYLAAFEVLGDGFLRDPLNSEWQKAIRATTPESRAGIKLCGTCPLLREQGVEYPLPNLEKHQHFVSILCHGSFPFVFVELFGCEALTCCCWLSITSNLGMGNGEAHLVLCDAVAKSVDRRDHS
jgi:hypothetical protein